MLIDQLNEQKLDVRFSDGIRHGDPLDVLKARLKDSVAHVLSPEASALAAGVSLSRPSSVVSALPWLRLPFAATWIEFENAALRRAMAELGSPNMPVPGTMSRIVRSGFRIVEDGPCLLLDYVHADETPRGNRLVELAPIQGRFSLESLSDLASGSVLPVTHQAKGRVQDLMRLVSSDPREAAAATDLRARFTYTPHPDLDGVSSSLRSLMGPEKLDAIRENQAGEMWRLFSLQILPSLILLNCRNAVDVTSVEVSEKVNRARLAKGKAPLRAHRTVTVHLLPRRSPPGASSPGRAARDLTSSLVMGHFKVRRTGVFWWNPHVRGARSRGGLEPELDLPVRVMKP